MTTAQDQVRDSLDRAQLCWDRINTTTGEGPAYREAIGLFLNHVTTAVLLEHLRRVDPTTADRITPWLLSGDGIFSDSYAGELVHRWREQLSAGQPLDPIGPDEERTS